MNDIDVMVKWLRLIIDQTDSPQDRALAYEAIDDLVGWQ